MPPQELSEPLNGVSGGDLESKQSLFIIRHGDRWDYSHPEWRKTATRPGDPSLSSLGFQQARETGRYLDALFSTAGIHANDVTLLSSPFLRTIQTSDCILSEFRLTKGDVAETVHICPEYSVSELDVHGEGLHDSLPQSMQERKWYFPRVDDGYTSMFVPCLPESREQFLQRCNGVIDAINTRFPFCPKTAVVIVTHAAGCIALAKAATGLNLQEINTASPCSVYHLTRSCQVNCWDLDHFSKPDTGNGYTGHLSDLGTHTTPWNHFGNKQVNGGYTGPPSLNTRSRP